MENDSNKRNGLTSVDVVRSLTIALGLLSENIDITHIRIPKACNSSIYTLKSKDGLLDESISFVHTQKRPSYFRDIAHARQALINVLDYMYITEMNIGSTPIQKTIELFANNEQINNRIGLVVESAMDGMLSKKPMEGFAQAENQRFQLDEFFENADKPSRELHAIAGATYVIDAVHHAITHDTWPPITQDTQLVDIATHGCKQGANMQLNIKNLHPSYYSYLDTLSDNADIDYDIEKEKTRLLLLSMLAPPLARCGIVRLEQFSNQLLLKLFTRDGDVYLNLDRPIASDILKQSRINDIKNYKKALYTTIYEKACGCKIKEYPPMDILERMVYLNLLNKKTDDVKTIYTILKDTLEICQDANFNHDETLVSSALLQAMCILGKNPNGLPDLSKERKLPDEINPKLDALYDFNRNNKNKRGRLFSQIAQSLHIAVALRQKYRMGTGQLATPIDFAIDDMYFANGENTQFFDVLIKNNALANIIDALKDEILLHPEKSPNQILRTLEKILIRMIGVTTEKQRELHLINKNSTVLPHPGNNWSIDLGRVLSEMRDTINPYGEDEYHDDYDDDYGEDKTDVNDFDEYNDNPDDNTDDNTDDDTDDDDFNP